MPDLPTLALIAIPSVLAIALAILWQRERQARQTSDEQNTQQQQQLNTLKALIEGSQSAILRLGPDLQIRSANRYAQQLFDYDAEQLIGDNLVGSILPSSDHEGNDQTQALHRLLDQSERRPGHLGHSIELENRCRDNRRVWCIWSFNRITDPSTQEPELIAIGIDTTLHRRAESLVLTQNRILSEVARGSAFGFILQSVCKLIRYRVQGALCTIHTRINQAPGERELVGIDIPNELLQALSDWNPQDALKLNGGQIITRAIDRLDASDKVILGAHQHDYQTLWLLRFGQDRHCGVICIWLQESGREPDSRETEVLRSAESICGISAERDDSDRQLNEARINAEAQADAKSSFLARMSHEIRTPMAGIIGVLGLLRERDDIPQEPRQQLAMAYNASEGLLALLNDILDISKIEAGKLTIEHVRVDLHETLEDLAELFAQPSFSKGVEICAQISAQLPRHIESDPTRLRQVIANLISNAVKFTQQGSICIRAYLVSDGDSRVRIDVTDTGIGIEPQAQSRIFESYEQANSATTRQYGGTGLGLPLTREIAERLGGQIRVQSTAGQGSTFSFEFPLSGSEGDSASREPSQQLPRPLRLIAPHGPISDAIQAQIRDRYRNSEIRHSTDFDPQNWPEHELAQNELWIAAIPADAQDPSQIIDSLNRQALAKKQPLIVLSPPTVLIQLQSQPAPSIIHRPVRAATLIEQIQNASPTPDSLSPSATKTAATSPTPSTAPRRDNTTAQAAPKGPRLLLVEDQDVNRLVARGLLKRLGLSATEAENGAKALAAVKEHDFDLVLMDCEMPIMDGYDATTAIREHEKTTGKHVPIVALTAHALPEHRERCLAVGMDDYLSKPYKLADLDTMVQKWIDTPADSVQARDDKAPAAASTTQNPSPLDEAEFAEILETFGDDIADLVDSFNDVVPSKLDRLQQAIEQSDADSLRSEAHAFKGIANTVAARSTGKLLKQLEDLGANGTTEGAAELFNELQTLAQAACNRLKELSQ